MTSSKTRHYFTYTLLQIMLQLAVALIVAQNHATSSQEHQAKRSKSVRSRALNTIRTFEAGRPTTSQPRRPCHALQQVQHRSDCVCNVIRAKNSHVFFFTLVNTDFCCIIQSCIYTKLYSSLILVYFHEKTVHLAIIISDFVERLRERN